MSWRMTVGYTIPLSMLLCLCVCGFIALRRLPMAQFESCGDNHALVELCVRDATGTLSFTTTYVLGLGIRGPCVGIAHTRIGRPRCLECLNRCIFIEVVA